MTYTPTYISSDMSAIVIDFLGNFGVQFIPFAGILALAVIAIWFMDHF